MTSIRALPLQGDDAMRASRPILIATVGLALAAILAGGTSVVADVEMICVGLSASRLLMPMGFCAILGGTITMVPCTVMVWAAPPWLPAATSTTMPCAQACSTA